MSKKASKIVEIIKDRLYWVSDNQAPKKANRAVYFNIDSDLQYEPFHEDFGPLNLSSTHKYVCQLTKLLKKPELSSNIIYHQTSTDEDKTANSAYLMGAFQVISLGLTAEKAYEPFKQVAIKPFRDASYGPCTYSCTLLDCLRGLEHAIKLGWFDSKTFKAKDYEHYAKVENGDLNWIIPGKVLAFSSPSDFTHDDQGNKLISPKTYVPIFKEIGVTSVIRLNHKTYQAKNFIDNGINHHDLYFTDGSVPSLQIVDKFIKTIQKSDGGVAVHCTAGLGRTGSLIGCYAMKHYGFRGADFIGWIRIARPGSVLGPQQHFLIEIEKFMKQNGQSSQNWQRLADNIQQKEVAFKLQRMSMKSQMSKRDREIQAKGELKQGENLVASKHKNGFK